MEIQVQPAQVDVWSDSNPVPIRICSATEQDQLSITALVRSERLNPLDLDWHRFVVATDHAGVVGAVQLRKHFDGSRELGSLVVRKGARGRGIAARLIDALLSTQTARIFMITRAAFATHYERWGFRPVEPVDAPSPIRRNYLFGRLAGILSLLQGRRPNKLVVLDRNARVTSSRLSMRPLASPPRIERGMAIARAPIGAAANGNAVPDR